MANLIIKSSADDLVLKGSGGNSAITVAAAGTTTFAQNATLSGTANNLGTVTAGSIAGGSITSATTFPAGHVVQCKRVRYNTGGHLSISSGNSWQAHGSNANLKFTFTPLSDDSTLWFEYNYGIMHASSTGGTGAFAFTRDGTGNRNPSIWSVTGYSDNYGHFMGGAGGGSNGMYHAVNGVLQVVNTATTSFELGLDVLRHGGSWYYAHVGCAHTLSCTETLN